METKSNCMYKQWPLPECNLQQTLLYWYSFCHEYANMRYLITNTLSSSAAAVFLSFFLSTRLVKIKDWIDRHDPGALVIPFSGGLENKLQDMSEGEMQKYYTEHKTRRLISIQSPHTLLSAVSSMHSFNCMC